jgi:hypothetical protein
MNRELKLKYLQILNQQLKSGKITKKEYDKEIAFIRGTKQKKSLFDWLF